ncbi:adhesion G-protein coupled receptor G7-like isoform X1 [Branchiostoma floridae x Branchiostoma japonicum]
MARTWTALLTLWCAVQVHTQTTAPSTTVEPPIHQQTCQGETLHIECPPKRIIDVYVATYAALPTPGSSGEGPAYGVSYTEPPGRSDAEMVQDCTGPVYNRSCRFENALQVVKKHCDGKWRCGVSVGEETFGYVCPETEKQLKVTYRCIPAEVARACENRSLQIGCEVGRIHVTYANYGRTSATICPEGPGTDNTECISERSQEIVSRRCNGKRLCTVPATNGVFTDPCRNTAKYLEVMYLCLREGMANTTVTVTPTETYRPSPAQITLENTTVSASTVSTTQLTTTTMATPRYCAEDLVETATGPPVIFPRTEAGTFAYSQERCASPSGNGKPHATRYCRENRDGTVAWDPPIFLICDVGLGDLSQTTVTSQTAVTVATELQVITTQSETLTSDEVTTTSVLIQEIVSASPTEQVGDSLLTTVDNLMSANATVLKQSQQERQGPTRVAQALERFADTVTLTERKYTTVRPAVALQAVDVSLEELDMGQGFSFSTSGNKTDSLASGSVSSFTTASRAGSPQNTDISITLPTNLSSALQINNTADVRVSYILYNDSSLFIDPSQGPVGSRIIGSKLAGLQVKDLTKPVVITLTPLEDISPEDIETVRCVFWDFEAEAGQGAWSSEGCEYKGEENGVYTCEVYHLTNFAAFFDLHGSGFGVHETPLQVITIVGCAISIVGLVLTLLSFIITRKYNRRTTGVHARIQRMVLINLCVTLLAILIIFLAGINQTGSPIGCTVVTALLHYFLLAALIWMAMEAINIYLAAVMVFEQYVTRNFIPKAAALAYGFPFIAMILTVGPSSLYEYRNTNYCWLAQMPLIYAFLLPAGVILLFNLVLFCIILYNLAKRERKQIKLTGSKKDESDPKWIVRQLRRAVSLLVLFGLTWMFGFFVINDTRIVFAYLFCIFNTLQGLFIFIFHCVLREDVQKWWDKVYCKGRKKDRYIVKRSTFSSSTGRTPERIHLNVTPTTSRA